jgi:hypothetical protein
MVEDLQRRFGAVQFISVDARLEPERRRPVAHGGVEELAALARRTGGGDIDEIRTRPLDAVQGLDDVGVARDAPEADVLVGLDARTTRIVWRVRGRGGNRTKACDQGDHGNRDESLPQSTVSLSYRPAGLTYRLRFHPRRRSDAAYDPRPSRPEVEATGGGRCDEWS